MKRDREKVTSIGFVENEIDEPTVAVLEELLMQAREGKIIGLLAIAEYAGPTYRTVFTGNVQQEPVKYLGWLAEVQFDLIVFMKKVVSRSRPT